MPLVYPPKSSYQNTSAFVLQTDGVSRSCLRAIADVVLHLCEWGIRSAKDRKTLERYPPDNASQADADAFYNSACSLHPRFLKTDNIEDLDEALNC